MSPKTLFDKFNELFNWLSEHAKKYKANRKDGGIDIYLDSGEILNFQVDKEHHWILRRK